MPKVKLWRSFSPITRVSSFSPSSVEVQVILLSISVRRLGIPRTKKRLNSLLRLSIGSGLFRFIEIIFATCPRCVLCRLTVFVMILSAKKFDPLNNGGVDRFEEITERKLLED